MLQVFARGIEPTESNRHDDDCSLPGHDETTPTPNPSLDLEALNKGNQFLVPSP